MGINVNDVETQENKIIPWIKRSARETFAKRLVGESNGNRRHHRKKATLILDSCLVILLKANERGVVKKKKKQNKPYIPQGFYH